MKDPARFCLIAGAIFALFAVVLGAFGAHFLKAQISLGMLQVFKTGVQYQMYHAFGILLLGLMMKLELSDFVRKRLKISACLFMIGIVLFSGSLYVLSITGIKVLGAITPVGGLAFMAAWLYFILAAKDIKQS